MAIQYLCRGLRLWSVTPCSDANSNAHAPSFTLEALPAVILPSLNGAGNLASRSEVSPAAPHPLSPPARRGAEASPGNLLGQTTTVPSSDRPLVGTQGKSILVLATDGELLGQILRRLGHGSYPSAS